MASDLAATMEYIGKRYTFAPDHYPLLQKLSSREHLSFAIKHSVFHLQKSLGKLATECEASDHGGEMNESALDEAVIKTFINTLKLAQELGMSASQLLDAVPKFMKS